jgi:hypothetical protein
MMTAPGIAIVNPNPKIAAINLDFDFIDTSPLLETQTLPERMQVECQGRAVVGKHLSALFVNKLGEP